MKVLSWNYRGLGSKVKEEAMKDLISLSHPDILLIQETKMEEDAFFQVKEVPQSTQGEILEALEPLGMSRNLKLLISSIIQTGSSPC